MYKQTTIKTEAEPVIVSREGPTSLTGVAVVIAVILLMIGALLIFNSSEGQKMQQAVTNQQQFDTKLQQSATSQQQDATSRQQAATQAQQQSAPAQGLPGLPGATGATGEKGETGAPGADSP